MYVVWLPSNQLASEENASKWTEQKLNCMSVRSAIEMMYSHSGYSFSCLQELAVQKKGMWVGHVRDNHTSDGVQTERILFLPQQPHLQGY